MAAMAKLPVAHLIGPAVTGLLPGPTPARQCDLAAHVVARSVTHVVARSVHAQPSLGGAVKEAVYGPAGHMIEIYQYMGLGRRCARR
jgi:hypothetical protein